jgi:peptidoglycan/LPS O-acetylase OafA/YrhL
MRIQQLDALRAIAVLLVLGHHLSINGLWFRVGWSGVDLFFVLSGFLISGLLFREFQATGGFRVGRFLTRRGLKIYPVYFLLLAGTAVYLAAGGRNVETVPGGLLFDAVFIQNYIEGTWGHLWSLAVEEHFYILLPAVLWALIRLRGRDAIRAVPFICAVPLVLCLAFRLIDYFLGRPLTLARATHLRMDSLAFGVLISYACHFAPGVIERLTARRGILLGASLVLASVAALGKAHPFTYTVGYSLLYLGYGGLLIYCLRCVDPARRWVRMLAGLGRYSYTIYLFHPAVLKFVQSPLHLDGPFAVSAYFIGTAVAGIGIAKVVEQPALRVRERLLPEPSRPVAAPSTSAIAA